MDKKLKFIVIITLSILLLVLFNIIVSKQDNVVTSVSVPTFATVLLIYLNLVHTVIKGHKNIGFAEDSFLEVLLILTSGVIVLYNLDAFFSRNYTSLTYISSAIVLLSFLWKKLFSRNIEDRKKCEKLYLIYNYAVVSFFTIILL